MSIIDCDYQAEIRTAVQMAETATSDIERFEWLFLALAWQALARCHDETFPQDGPAQAGAECKPAP